VANEFDVLKSFAAATSAITVIEKEIAALTGLSLTVVRETVQRKAHYENGNQYAAAMKWLDEIKARPKTKE
jgi:hypothetical protein